MQLTILSPSICSLVPNSTRPVWHQWNNNNNFNFNEEKENNLIEKNNKNNNIKSNARRRLFFDNNENNEEINNKENKDYVKKLLKELSEHCKQKWGFDFDECKPLEKNQSRFIFEKVPANQVPGFYRNSFKTTTKILLKEKQCFVNEIKTTNTTNCLKQQNNSQLKTSSLANNSPINSSLRKPPFHLNSIRTPKRRLSLDILNWPTSTNSSDNNNKQQQQKQTKITDFINVRKSFSPNFNSVKFQKIGEDKNEILIETPKKRRLISKTEKTKKFSKINSSENNSNNCRRSLRLRHLYAQNTSI